MTFFFLIHRSSKRLWAVNTQCTTPPLEQDGPWKTRPPSRTTIRSWTTCWVNLGTNGTPSVASQLKGKDTSLHVCFNYQPNNNKSHIFAVGFFPVDDLSSSPADKTSLRRPCCSPASLQMLCRLSLTGCTEWNPSWRRTSPYTETLTWFSTW